MNIFKYESRTHSQNGEDGILQKIISDLKPESKKSMEFGAHPNECNTRILQGVGFKTIMLDARPNDHNIHKEFITEHNINKIIEKYNCQDISTLSIDIDGQDFFVWRQINSASPLIVIIEYNCRIPSSYNLVMKRDPNYKWPNNEWPKDYSCGVRGLYELGKRKGYSLVGSTSQGVNLFFVRNDFVKKISKDIRCEINRPDLVYQLNDFKRELYEPCETYLNI